MARQRQKHFVGYHNSEKMAAEQDDTGEESGDEAGPAQYGFLTKKPTGPIVGGVIWWITGENKPREYYLDGWFVVDGAEPIDAARFESRVYGTEGVTFDEGILLNDFDWWEDFREAQGRFGLGIQEIQPQHLAHLVAAVREAGCPLPQGLA
jgi:hypothetical protein